MDHDLAASAHVFLGQSPVLNMGPDQHDAVPCLYGHVVDQIPQLDTLLVHLTQEDCTW